MSGPTPGDAADEIGMAYIKPVFGDLCGPHGARMLYFRNIHRSIRIRVFVRHHWLYQGERHERRFNFVQEPNPNAGAEPTSLDREMGCPIPGPTMQLFQWDVYDAKPA